MLFLQLQDKYSFMSKYTTTGYWQTAITIDLTHILVSDCTQSHDDEIAVFFFLFLSHAYFAL